MAQTLKTYQVTLGTSNTDIVPTVLANKRFRVSGIIVGNVNTATKHFSIHKIPSGQTASDQYIIGSKNKRLVGTSDDIGGGEWYCTVPFHLDTGDKISGIAESASSITVFVTGIEEDI